MQPESHEKNLFTRFVQTGRLCIILYGKYYNQVAVIVDIVDQNRVLIDGPTTGVPRQLIPMRHIRITDFVDKNIQRGARTRTVKKFLEESQIVEEFEKSSWGKSRACQDFRDNMTDFERFKLMVAHKKRSKVIQQLLAKAH